MPCVSEHMSATGIEVRLSRVFCLLDELDGKSKIDKAHWSGYHPGAYCSASPALLDRKTAELCARLQSVDVARHSLEMQIWWRDHQAADKARGERELAQAKTTAEREAALAKLTPHERKLLGVGSE